RRAFSQPAARCEDAFANGGGTLTRPARKLFAARPRHREQQVEPVEQRTRELLAVAVDALRCARAPRRAVAARAARTQVHRADQLEARRKHGPARHTRDADDAIFERLAERLEHRPLELGQLVEKEHPAVRKTGLARPRTARAA